MTKSDAFVMTKSVFNANFFMRILGSEHTIKSQTRKNQIPETFPLNTVIDFLYEIDL